MINKRIVCIKNRKEEKMYGILSSSVSNSSFKELILFCQAGVINKSGLGDYSKLLADELAAAGYYVLRFDQSGTGDSDGEIIRNVTMDKFFREIQAGSSVNDTLDVLEWVRRELSPDRIFLWGQCGGCVTAVMACAIIPEYIDGLMLLTMPVLYSSEEESQGIREFDAQLAGQAYLRKLLNVKSYLNFFTGNSDFRLLWLSLGSLVRKYMQGIAIDRKRGTPDHKMFNWHFWEAFKKVMIFKRKIIFLMAELDNETPDFDYEFKKKVLDRNREYSRFCEVVCLPKTDHSFLFVESRHYLQKLLLSWLSQNK